MLTKYHEAGRQRTLVGDLDKKGLGILDDKEYTRFGEKIDYEVWTRPLFLLQEKQADVTFTKAYFNVKPEWQDVNFEVEYYIDGVLAGSETFSARGKQVGGVCLHSAWRSA